MKKIRMIRSGGQTGVDRAALDTAKAYGIDIGGWCPKGGWAEDHPDPPGILALYPELCETALARPWQRTVRNVRDADATLIIVPAWESVSPSTKSSAQAGGSPGTELTERAARMFGKPCLRVVSADDIPAVINWLGALPDGSVLNIAGPRASEWPEGYDTCRTFLRILLESLDEY